MRERHKEDGTSVSHAEKQGTGKLYVQCLLNDLSLGDCDEWITKVEGAGDAALENAMADLLRQLVAKIKAGDRWQLPEGRYGSEDEKRSGRPIVVSHVKEINFALTRSVNVRRASGCGSTTLLMPRGYFQRIASYKQAEMLLSKRSADALKEAGKEADQRREIVLYDHEQVRRVTAIMLPITSLPPHPALVLCPSPHGRRPLRCRCLPYHIRRHPPRHRSVQHMRPPVATQTHTEAANTAPCHSLPRHSLRSHLCLAAVRPKPAVLSSRPLP